MEKTNWFEKAVVYQIYPFSFKDSNNDGWGDIPGIISKLDYVKELGVTAIWFSPLYVSPDKDFGYDIADYRNIDPKFGTLEDFKVLLQECHQRNLKVIMDMVINHTSDQHPWFLEAIKDRNSRYRDYYIIREGRKKGKRLLPPTNWTSSFTGSAWERIEGTDEYYLHLFTKEQPDLNWENPSVRDEIVDILNYWMDMGVDGFRFDVFNLFSKVYPLKDGHGISFQKGQECFVDGPRMHEFLQELNRRALGLHDSYTVGETYIPDETHAYHYVKKDNKELDTVFHFEHLACDNFFNLKFFAKPMNLGVFKNGLFGPQMRYHQDAWNTIVLENHDLPRSVSRFGIDTDKYRYEAATMLPVITFLGFGIPFIYMGEEIGMTNMKFSSMDELMDPVSHFVYNLMRKYHIPKKFAFRCINNGARDQARLPMSWDNTVNGGFNEGTKPWQCVNPNYHEINVEADRTGGHSVYQFYQKLLRFKKENDTAIYGSVQEYSRNNRKVVAFARHYEKEILFVVGNFSNRRTLYRLPKELSGKKMEVVIHNYDDCVLEQGKLTMRPYESLVFQIKEN